MGYGNKKRTKGLRASVEVGARNAFVMKTGNFYFTNRRIVAMRRLGCGPRRTIFRKSPSDYVPVVHPSEAPRVVSGEYWALFNGTQVSIQPVERLLNHLTSGYVVPRIVDHAALVFFGCP